MPFVSLWVFFFFTSFLLCLSSLALSFPPSTPVVLVLCPLVPKLRGRAVFLKHWGNNLWPREQKEIFTVSVMKWIFAKRMESVNRVSHLVGKDDETVFGGAFLSCPSLVFGWSRVGCVKLRFQFLKGAVCNPLRFTYWLQIPQSPPPISMPPYRTDQWTAFVMAQETTDVFAPHLLCEKRKVTKPMMLISKTTHKPVLYTLQWLLYSPTPPLPPLSFYSPWNVPNMHSARLICMNMWVSWWALQILQSNPKMCY